MILTEFLEARFAEDKSAAERGRRHNDRETYANDNYGCLLVDPARVLAECEAKWLQITALNTYVYECELEGRSPEAAAFARDRVLWHMTLPYRGHPDFNERWKP